MPLECSKKLEHPQGGNNDTQQNFGLSVPSQCWLTTHQLCGEQEASCTEWVTSKWASYSGSTVSPPNSLWRNRILAFQSSAKTPLRTLHFLFPSHYLGNEIVSLYHLPFYTQDQVLIWAAQIQKQKNSLACTAASLGLFHQMLTFLGTFAMFCPLR